MRIKELEIQNFRGVKHARFENLGSTVVLAGPNGCGKSSVLDAIRFLKSSYGGYSPNEIQHLYSDFLIRPQYESDVALLFRDREAPVRIEATIELADAEMTFLRQHGSKLVRRLIRRTRSSGHEMREFELDFEPDAPEAKEMASKLSAALANGNRFKGSLTITKDGEKKNVEAVVLNVLFCTYRPDHLGVIDYHGPDRNYQRERLSGIKIDIAAESSGRNRDSALWNYTGKYGNIKTEMAAAYVRELIAEKHGTEVDKEGDLVLTLKELFLSFFPGKSFVGPQPDADGQLNFPVRLADGATHDINELSSGEKEVLFGYLRLRNTSPRNSTILLDEPELHLNPRLVSRLPAFYHQYLGEALHNQLWLVTHSDAFLRESIGRRQFSVFHMRAPTDADEPQAIPLSPGDDVEQAVIALTGDLATHHPNATVVIFEGGESEFDVTMTQTLFPEFAAATNMVSAGNKRGAQRLHELLEKTANEASLTAKFFSVTDRDSDDQAPRSTTAYEWDVYHIENYLLEAKYISIVLRDLGSELQDPSDIEKELSSAAAETLDKLVRHRLDRMVWRETHGALPLRTDRSRSDIGAAVSEALDAMVSRMKALRAVELTRDKLEREEIRIRANLNAALKDGTWKQAFRGRDVLQRFSGRHAQGLAYEFFRNFIIGRMRDDAFQPDGMKTILDKILAA